jgi:hypothetical protein
MFDALLQKYTVLNSECINISLNKITQHSCSFYNHIVFTVQRYLFIWKEYTVCNWT